MKSLKLLSLLAAPTMASTKYYEPNDYANELIKDYTPQYDVKLFGTTYIGFDKLQEQIDEIRKELEELKKQGKEYGKKFNDLKETLIKLQEQLKYNEQKDNEQSKKIDKIEDKINNSTIATCSTVGGGVVLATVPTLIKNKKKK